MAAPKKRPKPKLPTPPRPTVPPEDYLRGGKKIGDKYTAWSTYGQGKPDFGKGAGPGDPYHEVTKTNVGRIPKPKLPLPSEGGDGGITPTKPSGPTRPTSPIPRPGVPSGGRVTYPGTNKPDFRASAIRRRLGQI